MRIVYPVPRVDRGRLRAIENKLHELEYCGDRLQDHGYTFWSCNKITNRYSVKYSTIGSDCLPLAGKFQGVNRETL